MLNGARDLVKNYTEKAKELNSLFESVFTIKSGFRNPRPLRSEGKSGTGKNYPHWTRTR